MAAVTFPLLLLSLTLLNDLVLWDLPFLQQRNRPSSLRLELGEFALWPRPQSTGGRVARVVMGPNVPHIFFSNGCSIF